MTKTPNTPWKTQIDNCVLEVICLHKLVMAFSVQSSRSKNQELLASLSDLILAATATSRGSKSYHIARLGRKSS